MISETTRPHGGPRVLLVEDDALTREVLPAALAGSGFEVHAEPDGTRVERAAVAFKPAIALIDMRLGDGVDGIAAVLRRSGREGRTVIEPGDLRIDADGHSVVRAGHTVELAHREFALLVEMCRHPGMVLSKLQLLTSVWGFEQYDLNVVEVYVSALRRKLEEHGPRVIHTVRNAGYVLRS